MNAIASRDIEDLGDLLQVVRLGLVIDARGDEIVAHAEVLQGSDCGFLIVVTGDAIDDPAARQFLEDPLNAWFQHRGIPFGQGAGPECLV